MTVETHLCQEGAAPGDFQGKDRDVLITPEPLFEMAFFPHERGMYNFNPSLDASGLLPNPRENYGGVTQGHSLRK